CSVVTKGLAAKKDSRPLFRWMMTANGCKTRSSDSHLWFIAMRLLNVQLMSRGLCGLLLAGLMLTTSTLRAQDDNPFGAPPDAGAPGEAPAAGDNPFGDPGDAPADAPAEPAPAGDENPFGAPDAGGNTP